MIVAQKRRRSGDMKVVIPEDRESGVRLRDDRREGSNDDLRKVAEAMQSASLGFDVCARRATEKGVAARMSRLADEARAIAEAAAAKVTGGVRKPTTSERMRWEWLASTAALLDGGVEGRIADEANRHLVLAEACAARFDDDAIIERVTRFAASSRTVAA